jgi:hypothetical protein
MSIEITPAEFVEKYKLIPQQLRHLFLQFLVQIPDLYDDDWNMDIFSDIVTMLVWFDKDIVEENYTVLTQVLVDEVYAGPCNVYYDVISCFLRYLNWKVPIITSRDVVEFHKRQVLKQIKSQVAYRPGNPGYEETKAHFESMLYMM